MSLSTWPRDLPCASWDAAYDMSEIRETGVRFEPDDRPPFFMTIGLGTQFAILVVTGIVLTPAIVVRAAGGSEVFLVWAAFAALVVSGLTTILQARRIGTFGAGHILIMGTSGAFIAVCVAALAEGGPGMLATLVLLSSLVQFTLARRLSILRRILTPAVTGTVIMLIPVTVMPIVFDMLADVPAHVEPAHVEPLVPALVASVTLVVMLAIAFGSRSTLRLWAPIIGIVVGCLVAAWFGFYDMSRVGAAGWIGIPDGAWPGFNLDFGRTFWMLLPAFIFVTYVGAIETIGDAVAIQSVSWKHRRAVDYKVVQGAVSADGVGNLLSGLAGTIPNTTYSTSIAVVELTGIASRRVGVCVGLVLVTVAFVPKLAALVLAIPPAVAAAYLVVLLGLLFVAGMRLVISDGMDYRKSLMVGTAFWIGTGFQLGVIFPDLLGPWVSSLAGNGMTAGGVTAVMLTVCLNLMSSRSAVLKTRLGNDTLQEISGFLRRTAAAHGWTVEQADRLVLVGDEMAATLISSAGRGDARRLVVKARDEGSSMELEFATTGSGGNVEDQIMLLGEQPDRTMVERELSLRLLRHYTSSVRHQSFTDADILTVRVERPSGSRPSIA